MSGTAKIEDATLTPGKLDLLRDWLAGQDWFAGDPAELEKVGSFRFVDPDGEVGIETLLVRSGGVTYQVPLTYRGAALDEADRSLIGTLEHSVLGTRWVYDAVGDPVYVVELLRVINQRVMRLRTGKINHYILFALAFLGLVFLLSVFNAI